MLTTFTLTVFAWIFFRAENISHAFSYTNGIISESILDLPNFIGMRKALITLLLIIFFLTVEWFGRNNKFAIQSLNSIKNNYLRNSIYLIITLAIISFGNFNENQFLYFQF